MMNETFVYNADIAFYVYRRAPLSAFQMMIYARILFHNDDIDKNVNHSVGMNEIK